MQVLRARERIYEGLGQARSPTSEPSMSEVPTEQESKSSLNFNVRGNPQVQPKAPSLWFHLCTPHWRLLFPHSMTKEDERNSLSKDSGLTSARQTLIPVFIVGGRENQFLGQEPPFVVVSYKQWQFHQASHSPLPWGAQRPSWLPLQGELEGERNSDI